jgi:flagella basal body P-ring formation protein FlgA
MESAGFIERRLRAMRQIIAGIVVAALAGSAAAATVTIELQAEARVSGGLVRLADVALVDGTLPHDAAGQALCPAPVAGETLNLSQARVRRRLVALLGDTDFVLRGAEECCVTRTDGGGAGEMAAISGGSVVGVNPSPGPKGPPSPKGEGLTGTTLKAQLEHFIAGKVNRPEERIRIEFDPRDAADLGKTDAAASFEFFATGGELKIGPAAVRVEMRRHADPRHVARTMYVRFQVLAVEEVVTAARDVRAGEQLAEADLKLERREFRNDPAGYLRQLGDATGATAKGDLAAGQAVREEDLAKTLLVRRGDVVTVLIVGRGFTMKTTSKALESGESGATVAVQGKDGAGKFYARVTAVRTVEMKVAG